MSRRPLTFYEFFAGGGMARLGLGAGWECLFANDRDPLKAATYRANFGKSHFHPGDVFDLCAADLPDVADLAWASSPCQDLSLAGGRAGLSGVRSSAFLGFWRLIEALNAEGRAPRAIVIENVIGLLTCRGGRDFQTVCRGLANQGYRFGALELDAAAFVPQSRRRVFIVGARTAVPAGRPQDESNAVRRAREALPADLRRLWIAWPGLERTGRNQDLGAILEPDDHVPWRTKSQTDRLIELMGPRHRAMLDLELAANERRVGTAFRRVRGGAQCVEVRFDGVAGCLRTPRGGSSRQIVIVTEGGRSRSRLITPREAARLMGLPDTYRLPSSATAALQVTGDGVAAPVVRWLANRILEPLLSDGAAASRKSYNPASKNRATA